MSSDEGKIEVACEWCDRPDAEHTYWRCPLLYIWVGTALGALAFVLIELLLIRRF